MTGELATKAYIDTVTPRTKRSPGNLMEYVATELDGECPCPILSEVKKYNNGKPEPSTSSVPAHFVFPHGSG